MSRPRRHRPWSSDIPLSLRLTTTAFLAVMVPAYRRRYGWRNFLWLSDVALFLATIALWTRSRLLASVAAVLALVPEIGWNADFLMRLLTGRSPLGLAGYMWDRRYPRYLRAISLFHVPLVPLLLYLVDKLGYDRRAPQFAAVISTLLLPVTYALTDPKQGNINWVHGPGQQPQRKLPPKLYLAGLTLALPLAFFLPAHLALSCWRGGRGGR